jgi:hypothetical protein
MWEEINITKLHFLAEVYNRMSQNISNYSFKSRATELEYMDIKRNCEPVNQLEAKETKIITINYNMKHDNTLLKMMEWTILDTPSLYYRQIRS